MSESAHTITDPPTSEAPLVISATTQEWRGKRYHLCGFYFSRRKTRKQGRVYLHRVVYEDCFGPVPPEHHVHHMDGDRSNNHPSNLQALHRYAHGSYHKTGDRITEAQSRASRRNLRLAALNRPKLRRDPITGRYMPNKAVANV